MNLTFVVSSGRSGSTLLSQILHQHPDVLSVSEFFACLQGVLRRVPYPQQDMDGAELWQILSAPDPIADALIRHGLTSPEMFYPYGSGRFRAGTGIPMICHSTLSLLSDDPDALFDRLAAEVPSWPRRPAADQYRAVFAYLAGLLGRTVVVERSGGSVISIGLLRDQFPEARLVHMYRDGPDCALSMLGFPMFKVGMVTYLAARAAGLPGWANWQRIQDALPARFRGLLSPPYDLSRLKEFEPDLEYFGYLWSGMMTGAVAALRELPGDQWDTLGYADLLRDPAAELTRFASIIGVEATPEWLTAADRLVDRGRPGKSARLGPAERAMLREACEPGMAALAEQASLRAAARTRSQDAARAGSGVSS
jgi:hypothetical protein